MNTDDFINTIQVVHQDALHAAAFAVTIDRVKLQGCDRLSHAVSDFAVFAARQLACSEFNCSTGTHDKRLLALSGLTMALAATAAIIQHHNAFTDKTTAQLREEILTAVASRFDVAMSALEATDQVAPTHSASEVVN